MKRRPARNTRHAFRKRANKTAKLNIMEPRRGGIRL